MTPTQLAAGTRQKALRCSANTNVDDNTAHFVIGWLQQELECAYTALQASPDPAAQEYLTRVELGLASSTFHS